MPGTFSSSEALENHKCKNSEEHQVKREQAILRSRPYTFAFPWTLISYSVVGQTPKMVVHSSGGETS